MTNREIKDLMRFFDNSEISKVKIKNGEFSIELQKGFENTSVLTQAPVAQTIAAPIAAETSTNTKEAKVETAADSINSPMVGTFYTAPAPGAEVFAKVGSVVKKGQTIGIIEAMKIMNEIEAEFDCRIIDILINDGQPVEYDMPIFAVEKI